MDNIKYVGKLLIIAGALLILVGGLMALSGKIPFFGRLPGDIVIQRKNFTFYFPIATGVVISLVLTLIFYLAGKR